MTRKCRSPSAPLSNAWMMPGCDSRAGPALALEAGNGLGIVQLAGGKDLDGDRTIELSVAGPEDGTHPALAELLQHLVTRSQEHHIRGR